MLGKRKVVDHKLIVTVESVIAPRKKKCFLMVRLNIMGKGDSVLNLPDDKMHYVILYHAPCRYSLSETGWMQKV